MSAISMTGFGRGSAESGGVRIEVELNTVNRKQFDFSLMIPQDLASLERLCRERVNARISRGRVQCQIKVSFIGSEDVGYDVEAIRRQAAKLAKLSELTGVPNDMGLSEMLKMPELMQSSATRLKADEVWPIIESALNAAVASLAGMRATEGAALAKDLSTRIESLEKKRLAIAELAPTVPKRYREALMRRVEELGVSLPADDAALAREVALCADRCDISEELTRLHAHFEHFVSLFNLPEPCGRPLDFLCQEMNREVNTIGSKATDTEITRTVIDMKSGIEAVREQVQNLE